MQKIKFSKVLIIIFIVSIFALSYVHQEIEILKTSFAIDKHRHQLSLLLDQHRSLVYNLSRLESPKRIEDTLSRCEITLCMPKIENIRRAERVSLVYANEEKEENDKMSFLASILDRFTAKAEAKVVK